MLDCNVTPMAIGALALALSGVVVYILTIQLLGAQFTRHKERCAAVTAEARADGEQVLAELKQRARSL